MTTMTEKKLNLYSTRRNTQDLRVFLAPAHSAANNSRERVNGGLIYVIDITV